MSNYIVIFLCLSAGVLARKLRNFPASSAQTVNSFLINFALPAIVLAQVPPLLNSLDLRGPWWIPVSMPWINFSLAYGFFSILGKIRNWSAAKIGALILTVGLGNTSFLGFPLLEALLGKEAIPYGILTDQPGSFFVISTLGLFVAAAYSGNKISAAFMTKKICKFPPFLALLLSIIWFFLGSPAYPFFSSALEKISATIVPLALFSVGFQLRFEGKTLRKRWFPLLLGQGLKLILFPAIFTFLYIQIFHSHTLAARATILESGMASMITAAILATEFQLDAEIANLMVGIGIPLSLITVPLWNYLLGKV